MTEVQKRIICSQIKQLKNKLLTISNGSGQCTSYTSCNSGVQGVVYTSLLKTINCATGKINTLNDVINQLICIINSLNSAVTSSIVDIPTNASDLTSQNTIIQSLLQNYAFYTSTTYNNSNLAMSPLSSDTLVPQVQNIIAAINYVFQDLSPTANLPFTATTPNSFSASIVVTTGTNPTTTVIVPAGTMAGSYTVTQVQSGVTVTGGTVTVLSSNDGTTTIGTPTGSASYVSGPAEFVSASLITTIGQLFYTIASTTPVSTVLTPLSNDIQTFNSYLLSQLNVISATINQLQSGQNIIQGKMNSYMQSVEDYKNIQLKNISDQIDQLNADLGLLNVGNSVCGGCCK